MTDTANEASGKGVGTRVNQYFGVIEKSSLFSGIYSSEMESMLSCLSARKRFFQKGEFVFCSGEKITVVGMVLVGSIHVVQEDFWGNRTIIAEASPGQLFGETYACIQEEPLGVSIIAAEKTEIMFLDIHKIMTVCTSVCAFHTRLIRNLLSVLAEKNQMLTKKMEHMARRTTREKLLSYLSAESLKSGSTRFEISFNRQQLAEYLAVDRSAMSNELCKLRDEGILMFHKNKFYIYEA